MWPSIARDGRQLDPWCSMIDIPRQYTRQSDVAKRFPLTLNLTQNTVDRAIVLAYNIPGVTNLTLTRQEIVAIYNGSLVNWSDPAIAEHNPGLDLPNATIEPVARYEASGSTEIFTSALSSFGDKWAAQYGVFNEPTGWNSSAVKIFAQRMSGMADYIRRRPYRIGYLTPASAMEVNLPYASIINRQGYVTVASKKSVQAAMNERSQNMSSRLTASLIDSSRKEAYPIASYSYFIVHMKHSANCSETIELARYIEWFLSSGQAETVVDNHVMIPVSRNIASRIRRSVLEKMTCNGQLLMSMVRQQKYDEEESLKTWKLPVLIISPMVAVIILCLVAYAIRQRYKYLRMLDHDDWKIDFVVPKKLSQTMSNSAADGEQLSSSGKQCDIQEVTTRSLSIASVFEVNRNVKRVLMRMRDEIEHENIARFFGISSQKDNVYLVEQHCANGTLVEFLRNNDQFINQSFRYVVCADIASGMAYLHRQNLIHGNLSIDKCHVDSRWTIKIVDWEYTALYDVVRRNQAHTTRSKSVLHFLHMEQDSGGSCSSILRHLAPEIQKDGYLSEPTRSGDVYSFGVIIRDLFVNFPQQSNSAGAPLPKTPLIARQIMKLACDKSSIKRPTFQQLETRMRSAIVGRKTNLLDR